MKNQIILLFLILTTSFVFGQQADGYVITRRTNNLTELDSVFGQITFPSNGILSSIKIKTINGKKKFKPNNIIGFKAGETYFSSIPYGGNNVFAERLINGPIELYYYTTKLDYRAFGGGLVGGLYAMTVNSVSSRFFVKSIKTNGYLLVPRSSKKVIDEIAFIFEDNKEIYDSFKTVNYKTEEIIEFVKKYNESINNQ